MTKKPDITPAMQFINVPEETPAIKQPKKNQEGKRAAAKASRKRQATTIEYKHNPEYIEKKTRRLQLVLQPSLYDRVKKEADKANKSVNDYIHNILEEATKGE